MDLWSAAATGDVTRLLALLSEDAKVDVDTFDDWGRTALMVATVEGKTAAVKCLVDAGASVEPPR